MTTEPAAPEWRNCPCVYCGNPLWAPTSMARGYCERCRIDRGEPAPPPVYPRQP